MSASEGELLHLTVDIWHPSCWTLETTRGADAGLYTHGTASAGADSAGVYTLYGRSNEALDALVATVRESSLTESITVLSRSAAVGRAPAGPTTRSVLVESRAGTSIRGAFTSRGFVHLGPSRHEDGREERSLLVRTNRRAVRRTLDDIEREYDADIDLVTIASVADDLGTQSHARVRTGRTPDERLSPRQREAFRLARSRDYYEYPRETTARELAVELDVSKTTFLEHLRKAEAKLLPEIELP